MKLKNQQTREYLDLQIREKEERTRLEKIEDSRDGKMILQDVSKY